MASFTSQHPDLLESLQKRIFFNEYMQEPESFGEVFNVEKSTRAFEDAMKVSGLGSFALKAEGSPVGYDDPVSGPRKRVIHSTFALGGRQTMEMIEDDQFNIMSKMPADLARSARDHRENLAWGVVNNGGTSTTGTLDGLALFSTAHPYLKSQGTSSSATQSNDLTPAVALSVSGIESVMNLATLVRDESGRFTPIKARLKYLIVPPGLQFEAARLLESEYEPFTSDNQINTMKSSRTGVQVKVVPYLTSSTNWFMATDKREHSLTFYSRKPVTTDSGRDFQTKDTMFDAHYRASACARDWRGVYRSAS
jgi:hypothetical protein